ncbi:hypothetical protein ES705_43420 [subsurface metagenome]
MMAKWLIKYLRTLILKKLKYYKAFLIPKGHKNSEGNFLFLISHLRKKISIYQKAIKSIMKDWINGNRTLFMILPRWPKT